MKVGVIGFQGDVAEHMEFLYKLKDEKKRDVDPVLVKSRRMLSEVSALIKIPTKFPMPLIFKVS